MAAIVSPVQARPVSQILPDEFDLFPVAESSSSRSKPIPRPRTADSAVAARRSHYRPFSTLYTESPYIELETAQTSRQQKRASSGLQWTMTLGLNFRPKKDSSPKASQFGVPPILKLSKAKQQQSQDATTKSPSTLRKKRSMTSLFTITSCDSDSNNNATAPSTPKSPHLLSPNMPDHTGPSSNLQRKSVTFEYKDAIDATEDGVREKHPLVVFIPKSHWVKRHNMKLHPYNNESSYMQAYDPILLESDRYADLLLQRLSNGSPSFHVYGNKPPATALDLGCGEGHWVLWAASIWKTTHITGFDMVDITLPAFETTENVYFKQGNFLAYKLPFPSKTFDYIRMANLSLCVPSDMWDHLFSEVERVLAKGGRLEFIDDEITFPYSDLPVPKNTALKSMTRSRSASAASAFDDYDDTDDSEYDSETLHDDSTEGSTLNSESSGSRPPSYDQKATEDFEASQLSASETVRPLPALKQNMTPEPAPVALDPFLLQSNQAIWLQRSALCRDIEKVFLKMLKENYHYTYPSQHVLGSMQKVFGNEAAGKTKSFRVDLAEWDSPIGPRALETADDNDREATSGKRRPWKVIDQLDRKDAKQQRRRKDSDSNKKKNGKDDFGTSSQRSSMDSIVPESLNSKAAKRLGLTVPGDAPPDSLNSKAAKRLGLPVPNSESASTMPMKSKTPPRERTPSPKLSNSLTAPQTVPSAKTAALLGLSYTALVAATAKATAGQRKGMKPEGYVQSPGLLIDNTKYVAIDPIELEMHACRFMHTLLGCRPVLGEYVGSHVGVDGNKLVDDDTFSYYMGEYEAFRRARLGWPTVAADEEDLLVSPPPPWKSSDASRIGYQPDKPATIRRIRVFQALKADDKLLAKLSPRLSRSSSSTPMC